MPSQEEYLDNLLKGIETENTETEVTEEPKMTGTEEETAKAPETPEPVEEIGTQVDMSDMDDLLQSALDAQKAEYAKLFFFILVHLKWNAVQCVHNIGRNFSEVLVKISGIQIFFLIHFTLHVRSPHFPFF